MKTIILTSLLLLSIFSFGQTDSLQIEKACLNYIEGFYEGDTLKMKECLAPDLYKFGYWKNEDSENYERAMTMTYDVAVDFVKGILEKERFAAEDDPKIVEVLDRGNTIACAKVTARWGIDYILLSKIDGRWWIHQVIWEGPLKKEEE